MYIEQKTLNTLVLAYFFKKAQSASGSATQEDVYKAFEEKIGDIRVLMALETLEKSDYITDISPTAPIYQITPAGYTRAEEIYLKPKSAVNFILEHSISEYLDLLKEKKSADESTKEIPAADRYVTLSDNMPGYSELVSTVVEANEAVRGSNELAAEERSWIKIHVDLGIELLRKGGRVLASAIKSLLIEPFEEALKETSQEGLRAAIAAALKAIRMYLGL